MSNVATGCASDGKVFPMKLGCLANDVGYRWREDVTNGLDTSAIRDFLNREAMALEQQEEWDSAYGIYRELVWRFPDFQEGWGGLRRVAAKLGRVDEVEAIDGRAKAEAPRREAPEAPTESNSHDQLLRVTAKKAQVGANQARTHVSGSRGKGPARFPGRKWRNRASPWSRNWARSGTKRSVVPTRRT